MKMNWLYDFNKWPESIPIYRLDETQHFLWGWLGEIGFELHEKPHYNKRNYIDRKFKHWPCYPVESKIK